MAFIIDVADIDGYAPIRVGLESERGGWCFSFELVGAVEAEAMNRTSKEELWKLALGILRETGYAG